MQIIIQGLKSKIVIDFLNRVVYGFGFGLGMGFAFKTMQSGSGEKSQKNL